MSIKIISLGLFVGLISGIALVYSLPLLYKTGIHPFNGEILDVAYPGIMYGIFTAPFFAYFGKKLKPVLSAFLWIIVSCISYFSGFYSIYYICKLSTFKA